MPYVYIDADEVMEDISDDELRAELTRRQVRRGKPHEGGEIIPKTLARETLETAATLLRKQGRLDIAYKLDETRIDYFL
jgi:hypothetical protein